MTNKNKTKISYETEADILIWEITNQPIDYAKEIGNVVVHFTKNNIPVLIAIVEASTLVSKSKNLVRETQISIKEPILAP